MLEGEGSEPGGRERCWQHPEPCATGFKRVPRPALGPGLLAGWLRDIAVPRARSTLLHGERRGSEKSTQRELAAAAETPPVPSSPPAEPDLPDQLPAGCGAASACTAAPGPDAHPGLNEILK